LILLILAAFGGYYWTHSHKGVKSTSFSKIPVTRGAIDFSITSTGFVSPENRVEVKPPITGRTEDLLVNEGAMVRKGEILAWMSSTERAALLDAARTKGKDELAHWETLYKATPIIAPISGTVINRTVNPGQTVGPTDAVLVLSDRLIVKVQVDETDIAKIKSDEIVFIKLDAYPELQIPASVYRVAYEAQTVNNVTIYEVDVLPKSHVELMRSGMTCNVTFHIASKSDALLLPVTAIVNRDGKSFVRVASPDGGRSDMVEVTTGISDGKNIEIVDGVSENAQVLAPEIRLPGGAQKRGTNPFAPGGGGGRR
jgi:macrolide-specific efflux system membrane fusion protein